MGTRKKSIFDKPGQPPLTLEERVEHMEAAYMEDLRDRRDRLLREINRFKKEFGPKRYRETLQKAGLK